MSQKILYVSPALLAAVSLLATTGSAQEQSIQKKDVPKSVLETFQKSYPKVTIKGYSKEVAEGTLTYEIESLEGNIHRDVTYSADGSLISIEETLPFAELPEPVRNTIGKEYPKGKISLCERVMKGPTTEFEVLITSGKQKHELVFNPNGTVVKKEVK